MKSWTRPLGYALVIALVGGAYFIGIGSRGDNGADNSALEAPDPGYGARDAEVIETGYDGRERYRLNARVIRQQSDGGVIDLEHLEMNYHPGAQPELPGDRPAAPKVAGETWHLTSDRGQVRANGDDVQLNGNVVVTGPGPGTGAPLTLTTEAMRINTPTEFIETESPVRVRWSGHELLSRGMKADLKAGTLRLESDVHGEFSPVRHLRIAAACCIGLLGVAAAAQSPRETQKIVVDAVPVDVNYRDNTALLRDVVITQGDMRIEAAEARVKGGLDFENGEWTISGNVRIDAEGGKLRADKAVVSFRNNLISRATITGTPAEFEQLRKDGTTSKGRAPTIDYQTTSGTVSFRDNAWLSDGCNEITAKELFYNIKEQRVQGQPNPLPSATPVGGGRVRIVIQPKDQTGDKPCAAPGKKP